MTFVQLSQVRKRYGEVQALQGISFDCSANEFLVIIGASGAGKTSTLKIIAGLESVTGGEIFIDGQLMNHLPPEERGVGMVFETYALYPHLSVYENLAFPLRSRTFRVSTQELERRVHATAELLQIGHLLTRKPAELSGGQKQRVSLGRALIKQPRLLLMDEPLSHLDAKLRHHMRHELKKYQHALNATVIYVTHDYLEALALADRIVVLHEGRILQTDTPDRIYHRPADTIVASLVGQPKMNFIACRVHQNSAEARLLMAQEGSFEMALPPSLRLAPPGAGDVIVGIRPQHLKLSRMPNGSGIHGTVYVSENVGVKQIVEVQVGTNRLKALVDEKDYHLGQQVTMRFDADHLCFFDSKSGKSVLT